MPFAEFYLHWEETGRATHDENLCVPFDFTHLVLHFATEKLKNHTIQWITWLGGR